MIQSEMVLICAVVRHAGAGEAPPHLSGMRSTFESFPLSLQVLWLGPVTSLTKKLPAAFPEVTSVLPLHICLEVVGRAVVNVV